MGENGLPSLFSYEKLNDNGEMYYKSILNDYEEMKNVYPYSYLTILPSVEARTATIKVIAVDRNIINLTSATEEDCTSDYSRELWVSIPENYNSVGCDIYGGKWIDIDKIPQSEQHVYEFDENRGYKFCVGVPDSFGDMKNVILENVRTADHILTAYADYISGRTNRIVLKQFSHGKRGIDEYKKSKK